MISVVLFVVLIFDIGISSSYNSSDHSLVELTKNIVDYNLHFHVFDLVKSDKIKCDRSRISNNTEILLQNSISQCANIFYNPKHLSVNQVSWRPVEKDSESSKVPHQSSKYYSGKKKTVGKNSSFTVHNYFGMALLLPNHPFSAQFSMIIKSVSIIYPSINFATGNGYEFTDLCIQYGVQSFPKLLFFKNGLLIGSYRGDHDVSSVAAQVAKWTHSLPSAIPVDAVSKLSQNKTIFEVVTANPKMDPILWISPQVFDLDYYLYMFSAGYITMRLSATTIFI